MVKDPFIVKDTPTCVPTPHILPLPTPDILPLTPDLPGIRPSACNSLINVFKTEILMQWTLKIFFENNEISTHLYLS